ncbi:MAG TPA: NAD-dependent protein deacetylase [Aquabacterium sp.]|uniref:NAD-dependent protein deacetylase n=1 Tax=Aquabacterium sp. TaxID=1872578 RepID=UPI002E358C17|nr:NAD-dependent protein deacetylase [Aquabacterium sp.]HEX5356254.1 NAD-dependent protein deacetylase [Aquabacterium sp.]
MNEQGAASPDISRLAALLRQGPFAVITGAGLSTASGIPAYRDEHGQWQHARPIQHQAFLTSETVRRRYWARSFMGWPRIASSQPNPGHRALAALEHQGWLTGLITQNVDGLHQKAGSQTLIELHGALAEVVCLSCRTRLPRSTLQAQLEASNAGFSPVMSGQAPDGDVHLEDSAYADFQPPVCPKCAGILKPDVVFFGDNVPRGRVQAAMHMVEQAQGLIVVGSSLMVYSGFRFADQAHKQGKPVVVINQGITRADAMLSLKIDQECGSALTNLLQVLQTAP